MRPRVITLVVLTLLAVGGVVWILLLGTSDISIADRGNPTLRCDSIVHTPDLSTEDGEYTLDEARRRSDVLDDDDAELVDACGRVRAERVWTSVLVAVPTTLLIGLAAASARVVVEQYRRRPRPPAEPRRNEQPRL